MKKSAQSSIMQTCLKTKAYNNAEQNTDIADETQKLTGLDIWK